MRTVIKQCSHNIRQFESIKKGHSVPTIYFLIIYTNLIGWESAKTRKLIMQKEGNKIQISQRMEQETLYSGVTNGREIEPSCNSAHAQAQGY